MQRLFILGMLLLAQPATGEELPPIADMHSDSLTELLQAPETDIVSTRASISLENLRAGNVMVQVFAIWVKQKDGEPQRVAQAEADVFWDRVVGASGGALRPARTYAEVIQNHRDGVISAILAMEGADGLGGNAQNLLEYVKRGLRILSITWNNHNAFADGLKDSPRGGGLTEEGRILVSLMAYHRVIADMSHLHPVAFWDVVTSIRGPVIATHSNPRAIWDATRNLDDEQILAIAQKQGVVGLVYYREFVGSGKDVPQEALWDHYQYLAELVGPEFVGLGSDFGGTWISKQLVRGIRSPRDVPELLALFRQKGLDEIELDLLAFMNFLRVLRTADEDYDDIPPLGWRPLDVRPSYPKGSPPELYDRLSTTVVKVDKPMGRYEFTTAGEDFFALALRSRSRTSGVQALQILVQSSACNGDVVEVEKACPMDGSRCVVEVFGDGGSAGPCGSKVSVRLEPQGGAPSAPWEILDIVPLQRVIHRDP